MTPIVPVDGVPPVGLIPPTAHLDGSPRVRPTAARAAALPRLTLTRSPNMPVDDDEDDDGEPLLPATDIVPAARPASSDSKASLLVPADKYAIPTTVVAVHDDPTRAPSPTSIPATSASLHRQRLALHPAAKPRRSPCTWCCCGIAAPLALALFLTAVLALVTYMPPVQLAAIANAPRRVRH
ncbi:hypothetical protein AMAG_18264 [Allomyces macrogynus ATCC 38327]|uniref:Uncharacterized protein n=1 Tax=Allomyces macrogynus (strain ATCC 38327) TaxID=578462 RepID=A0A0L0S7Y3_ALLM3|nr:hypothetical protein AMAG_18264 [Allomyces macrogynus ATCC 38327]|eukprot:KNE58536.1 hypothetical protein AMAG_18264 [Allomyces macrogynus ATCC 38327]